MDVCFHSRETGEEIIYHDAIYYIKGADDDGPFIRVALNDGDSATFHTGEWECFSREWREVK